MNIWFKSLLIGLAAVALTFLANRQVPKRNQTFTVNYIIETVPDGKLGNGEYIDALVKLPGIIKKRCDAAGYSADITVVKGKKQVRVTIGNVDDTSSTEEIVTAMGRLEFREFYLLDQMPSFAAIFQSDADKDPASVPPAPGVIVPSDTSRSLIIGESKPVQPDEQGYRLDTLISLNTTDAGAQLGTIHLKDTSIVNKILSDEKTLKNFPTGIKFCYGPFSGYSPYAIINLYAIRAEHPAPLTNSQVTSAGVEYSKDGRPEVLIKFTPTGSRLFTDLTRVNKGRYIAILLDNIILTAPRVNDVVEGGSVTLSGSFSVRETQVIAMQLNSGYIPIKTNIVSREVTAETQGWTWKWVAILAGVFVLASALAWFAFNALRNR